MQRVENHVYRFSLQRLSICDQESTECEWIYPNNDELQVDDDLEQHVDYEKLILKE